VQGFWLLSLFSLKPPSDKHLKAVGDLFFCGFFGGGWCGLWWFWFVFSVSVFSLVVAVLFYFLVALLGL